MKVNVADTQLSELLSYTPCMHTSTHTHAQKQNYTEYYIQGVGLPSLAHSLVGLVYYCADSELMAMPVDVT